MKKSPGGQVAEMTNAEIGLHWLDAALWRRGNSSITHSRPVSLAPRKLFPRCSFRNCQKGKNLFSEMGRFFSFLGSFKSTVFCGRRENNVQIILRAEAETAERQCRLLRLLPHSSATRFASSSPSCYFHCTSLLSCSPAYKSLMALSPYQVPTAAGEHPQDWLLTK